MSAPSAIAAKVVTNLVRTVPARITPLATNHALNHFTFTVVMRLTLRAQAHAAPVFRLIEFVS